MNVRFGGARLRALAAAVCMALVAVPLTLQAHHVGEALAADQEVVDAGNRLLASLAQWQKLSPSLKRANLEPLVKLAQERQQLVIALVQADPRVAAARMIPRSIRARMPAEVAAFVEQEVKVQGTGFVDVADNFAAGVSRATFRVLGPGDPTPSAVYLADPTATERDLHRMAGKRVTFDAMRVGDLLVLLDKRKVQVDSQSLQPAGGASSGGGTLAAAGTVVQGEQKTLSILLNFSDKAVSCTVADVAGRVFGTTGSTVNTIYRDSSRGLVGFSGTAVGPYTIPYTSTGACDYSGWAKAADAAAKAAGFDPAQYARVNYVTPSNSTCGWSGLAYMPGRQSWVQSCSATGVYAHELGHNLSLHHAATPTAEYGDGSDPMGGAKTVGLNGANRVMAGWQPTGTVLDVSAGGSYTVASLSDTGIVGTPQVLRLPKPDTAEAYYVSLRSAAGYDTSLGSQYVNTISVHRATGTLPTRTYLLQVLAAGQTFTDSTNGIAVTNQGGSGGQATVAVTFSGPTCARSAPGLTVSPASQTAAPGATANYTVTVQNNNTAACGTSSFDLGRVVPDGFGSSLSATSLALAAGASGSVTLAVTSGPGTPDGTYGIDVTATDAAATQNQTMRHASLVVFADGVAPTVSITSPAANATLSTTKPLAIAASASDASGIQAVDFYVDGTLLARDASSPYTASWNARKAVKGTHTIRARATDTMGNTAEHSISITLK
jgi:hypothetical protein